MSTLDPLHRVVASVDAAAIDVSAPEPDALMAGLAFFTLEELRVIERRLDERIRRDQGHLAKVRRMIKVKRQAR